MAPLAESSTSKRLMPNTTSSLQHIELTSIAKEKAASKKTYGYVIDYKAIAETNQFIVLDIPSAFSSVKPTKVNTTWNVNLSPT